MADKTTNTTAAAIDSKQPPTSCKTRDEMLARFLTIDSLNDIVLKGNDGVEVPANRFLLAARSDVFMGMLLGKFQESSSPVVELGFSGSVLKAVVEFVLTDTSKVLNCKKRKAPDSEKEAVDISPAQIEVFVSLAEAASYFDLAGLTELVLKFFERLLKDNPCASFAILQACRIAGNSVPEVLVEKAKAWVQSTPSKSLSASHVAMLSTDVLEEMLMDSQMDMSEYELFKILSLWVDADPRGRKEQGVLLSKHISYEKIDIEKLTTTVAASGLAPSERLNEAYKNQALALKKHVPSATFQESRRSPWVSQKPDNSAEAPIAIKVQGAGTEEVNGVYTRDGALDGIPRYSMQGIYGGEQCKFWIYLDVSWWFIDILSGTSPHLTALAEFYKICHQNGVSLPTHVGWQ